MSNYEANKEFIEKLKERKQEPKPRRVVQLASDSEFLYALTSDNEIFEYNETYKEWNKLPPIPQDEEGEK